METPLWPFLVYAVGVVAVVGGMIGFSSLLGQRHREHATDEPYESGIVVRGSARLRFSAKFYLVGLVFLIFDLEAAFLFAWAIAFRQVGWPGYAGMLVFVGVLAAVFVYEWRLGVLDWRATDRRDQT